MQFDKAITLAAVYAAANKPVYISGAPGIGKSAMIHQMAKPGKLLQFICKKMPGFAAYTGGATVVDIRLSMFDPVDLRGLPATIDGRTVWLKPGFWPVDESKPVFIFFDEIDRASTACRNAALQIVLDRRIGEHTLPGNVRIFAAGNGATDKGFTGALGTALNNRFAHIDLEPGVAPWLKYAADRGLNPALIAFHEMRKAESDIFHKLNPGRDEKAFPTARAWESVHDVLELCPKSLRFDAVAGLVGEIAAGDFVAFLELYESIGDILPAIWRDPAGATVFDSSEINRHYAVAVGLAHNVTAATMPALCTYAARLPREFEILAISTATRIDPALKNCPAYLDYAQRNQHVFA